MNLQAVELNQVIQRDNPSIFELLSEKGKNIFFPKKGILGQTADAKGKKINATIGIALEDDGSPMRLKSIEKNISLDPKDVFPYVPSYGKPELRKEWKNQIIRKNPSLEDKSSQFSLPVVTNALTHGLDTAAYLFLDVNEKLILPEHYWGNYNLTFLYGRDIVLDTFQTFDGEKFNVEAFCRKFENQKGKKAILLNFPNNPTGYTPSEEEIDGITKVITDYAEKGNPIIVLIDDAYFGLLYEDGFYRESIFSKLCTAHENILAVKIDGGTKEDYIWGLRVGFITFGSKGLTKATQDALEAKTAGRIRGGISNVSHPSQSLVLQGLLSSEYDTEKAEKFEILQSRYQKVRECVSKDLYQEYFEPLPFNSGYFMCIRIKKDIPLENIRQTLLQEYSTGIIVMGSVIRIAFSSVPEEYISELFENIYQACLKNE